jgi:hypothetical protein
MSIPSRGSRRIRVDERDYAWHIRRQPTHGQAASKTPMIVAIQSLAARKGRVLLVDLRVSRPDNRVNPHQTGVTPAMVTDIVRRARAAGWDPMRAGAAFRFEYGAIRDSIGHVAP